MLRDELKGGRDEKKELGQQNKEVSKVSMTFDD